MPITSGPLACLISLLHTHARTLASFHCSKLLLECQIPQEKFQKIFLAHNSLDNTPLLQEEYVQVYFSEIYLAPLSKKEKKKNYQMLKYLEVKVFVLTQEKKCSDEVKGVC